MNENAPPTVRVPEAAARQQIVSILRAWGVSPGRKVVLYDEGGTFMAARVF